MITGVGNDVVETARIKKAMEKNSFVEKFFTPNEIEYLKTKNFSVETAAGMFAAKEAVSKAIGLGFRGYMPKDMEITHDEYGKPGVKLFPKAEEKIACMGKINIHLSISHCKEYATAFAVAEKEE